MATFKSPWKPINIRFLPKICFDTGTDLNTIEPALSRVISCQKSGNIYNEYRLNITVRHETFRGSRN